MTWFQKWKINHRIACPEAGYPYSEAMYGSFEEWFHDFYFGITR